MAGRCTGRAIWRATNLISCFRQRRSKWDFLRFPLADLTKHEIRDYAALIGLKSLTNPTVRIFVCAEWRLCQASLTSAPRLQPARRNSHMDGTLLGRNRACCITQVGQRPRARVATGEPIYSSPLMQKNRDVMSARAKRWRGRAFILDE
jgi:tRNA U34 2-thiouridine synthase MnmA/TrmU